MNPSPSALAGVRVLELGQLIAGPFAAKMLAEFGAEWIGNSKASNGFAAGHTDLGRWRTLDHDEAVFKARLWTVIPNQPIAAILCQPSVRSVHGFAGDIPLVPVGLAPARRLARGLWAAVRLSG